MTKSEKLDRLKSLAVNSHYGIYRTALLKRMGELSAEEHPKKFICVQSCPELDFDGSKHCTGTAEHIKRREELHWDFCPCGNDAKWEEIK